METDNELFCEERTYILECLLRQDPDHFLKGDWYDMFPSSTIEYHEEHSVQISIFIPVIDIVIKGVIADFMDTEGLFEANYKNIHIDKVGLYVEDHSTDVIEPDKPIKLKRDIRRIVVKKMREAFEEREHILESQSFNHHNIYDGDDIIGYR